MSTKSTVPGYLLATACFPVLIACGSGSGGASGVDSGPTFDATFNDAYFDAAADTGSDTAPDVTPDTTIADASVDTAPDVPPDTGLIRGCDLFEQTGCPDGWACDLDQDPELRAAGETVCRTVNREGGPGAACRRDEHCAPGLGCRSLISGGGVCAPYCQEDAECEVEGQFCLLEVAPEAHICTGSCSVYTGEGCPEDLACVAYGTRDEGIGTSCLPPGTGEEGEACEVTGCALGLICTTFGPEPPSCLLLCLGDDDCTGLGSICVEDAGVCTHTCDAVTSEGCREEHKCDVLLDPVRDAFYTVCVPEGAGRQDDPCTDPWDCDEGFFCDVIDDRCRTYCDLSTGDGCASAETCTGFDPAAVIGATEYGVCN